MSPTGRSAEQSSTLIGGGVSQSLGIGAQRTHLELHAFDLPVEILGQGISRKPISSLFETGAQLVCTRTQLVALFLQAPLKEVDMRVEESFKGIYGGR